MSTHLLDRDSDEGQFTACGRYYAGGAIRHKRGVVVTTATRDVSCQKCIQSERFRLVKTRVSRPLDAPIPERR